MNPQYEKAAEWLLIGFCKSWRMSDVAVAVGGGVEDGALRRLREACPFMPANRYEYKRPVRAFIVSEWPKLGAFLLKHEGNPQKVLSVVDQVKKLRSTGVNDGMRSREDKNEHARIKRDASVVHGSNRIAREQQLSTQRGAWNVCKA